MPKQDAPSAASEVRTKKKPKKVKVELLPDALVDGKLIVPAGTKIYFERFFYGGKKKFHAGVIREITDKGMVHIWDETIEQFYAFSLHQKLPIVKIA
jgi:hypothetical protein